MISALLKAQLIDGFGGAKKKAPDGDVNAKMPFIWHAPKSRDVEQGAYLLLTLVARGEREAGRLPAKWLMSKRNAQGGFSSTQVREVIGFEIGDDLGTSSKCLK